MRLTPTLSPDTTLTLESASSLPSGAADLIYTCS
jgi:hypothetical protein